LFLINSFTIPQDSNEYPGLEFKTRMLLGLKAPTEEILATELTRLQLRISVEALGGTWQGHETKAELAQNVRSCLTVWNEERKLRKDHEVQDAGVLQNQPLPLEHQYRHGAVTQYEAQRLDHNPSSLRLMASSAARQARLTRARKRGFAAVDSQLKTAAEKVGNAKAKTTPPSCPDCSLIKQCAFHFATSFVKKYEKEQEEKAAQWASECSPSACTPHSMCTVHYAKWFINYYESKRAQADEKSPEDEIPQKRFKFF